MIWVTMAKTGYGPALIEALDMANVRWIRYEHDKKEMMSQLRLEERRREGVSKYGHGNQPINQSTKQSLASSSVTVGAFSSGVNDEVNDEDNP